MFRQTAQIQRSDISLQTSIFDGMGTWCHVIFDRDGFTANTILSNNVSVDWTAQIQRSDIGLQTSIFDGMGLRRPKNLPLGAGAREGGGGRKFFYPGGSLLVKIGQNFFTWGVIW